MTKEVIRHYSKEDVTIVWQPAKCTHTKKCFHEMPEVFNPKNRPWVTLDDADMKKVIEQVKACPSQALSIKGDSDVIADLEPKVTATKVSLAKAGPLLIHGNLKIELTNGNTVEKSGVTALCRCGASANKPYCDGSHNNIEFKD